MIKQQLRTGDVLNERILSLYETIPRSSFVPESMRPFSYSDMQIPYGHDQRMLSPAEEGLILQNLNLTGTETILEVGTGTGFFTALLSKLCKQVISIEYFKDLSDSAKLKLEQYDCSNVELITADGHRGWFEKAPYDIVILSGAIEEVTETHLLQVLPGGKLVAFIGQDPVLKCIVLTLDHHENWTEKALFETSLPPLMNALKSTEFVF